MTVTLATLATLAPALVALVVGVRRTLRAQGNASPVRVRYGLDTHGRAWSVRRLDARSVRLYRGAHVYVDACGPRTLAVLTGRYGITWER